MLRRGGGVCQRFAWKHLDDVRGGRRISGRRRGCVLVGMRVAVIVILKIFEDVADVEESIAIEADVDESGLHAREDAGDSAFIDTTDEGELFFALDVNFY